MKHAFKLSILICSLLIGLTGVLLADDNKEPPHNPRVCDPELLSNSTDTMLSFFEKLLKKFHINENSTRGNRLKYALYSNPQTENLISSISRNVSQDQQDFFLEVIIRSAEFMLPYVTQAILTSHRKKSGQNERRLHSYILDQALYIQDSHNEVRTYANAVKMAIGQVVLSDPEESTELSHRLDLKVSHARPLSMSESDAKTEQAIEELLRKFGVQSNTLAPDDWVSPQAVLFRSFLRDEKHRQEASQAIDNFYIYIASNEEYSDLIREYMVYTFLLSYTYRGMLLDIHRDQQRFVRMSEIIFESLRIRPHNDYDTVYQTASSMFPLP